MGEVVSFIASMMDSNVIVAHEFYQFDKINAMGQKSAKC